MLVALLFVSVGVHAAWHDDAAGNGIHATPVEMTQVLADAPDSDQLPADLPSLEDNGGVDDTFVVPPFSHVNVTRFPTGVVMSPVPSLTPHHPALDLRPPIV
ncbi:hypothetical protein FHW69_003625 [Luteibacter sp. Sphag1AF]|uniref:hypothetical protein n=1 Tax=Luteibacter sp. Sphag1AF TaxID=2587031 RepID=UPI00160DC69D|nr:hypothetical protein [Luteibacter sp. Sphag1AF]MBB3228977.1 hypothetical protein [Luteibacter sp. Sphag1AF]